MTRDAEESLRRPQQGKDGKDPSDEAFKPAGLYTSMLAYTYLNGLDEEVQNSETGTSW